MWVAFAAHQGNKGERGLAVNLRISCFEMAFFVSLHSGTYNVAKFVICATEDLETHFVR